MPWGNKTRGLFWLVRNIFLSSMSPNTHSSHLGVGFLMTGTLNCCLMSWWLTSGGSMAEESLSGRICLHFL